MSVQQLVALHSQEGERWTLVLSQLCSSHSTGDPSSWFSATCIQVDFPSLVKPFWKFPKELPCLLDDSQSSQVDQENKLSHPPLGWNLHVSRNIEIYAHGKNIPEGRAVKFPGGYLWEGSRGTND